MIPDIEIEWRCQPFQIVDEDCDLEYDMSINHVGYLLTARVALIDFSHCAHLYSEPDLCYMIAYMREYIQRYSRCMAAQLRAWGF